MPEFGNNIDDASRSMKYEDVRKRRKEMLREPHMEALTAYVEALRDQSIGFVPWFDPLDGGVNAKALFLMEKPGPMTAEPTGSGFISRNNNDPTAKAICNFMHQAGIDRTLTIMWNVVPSWNGTRTVDAAELKNEVRYARDLIALLPEMRGFVFVGRKAGRTKPMLAELETETIESYHPSPVVRASNRAGWNAIPAQWQQVKPYLL